MIRILLPKLLGEVKWTQADLSRATGIRTNTINALYHGFAIEIKVTQLDAICEALGCEISELLVREPNPEPVTKRQVKKPKA